MKAVPSRGRMKEMTVLLEVANLKAGCGKELSRARVGESRWAGKAVISPSDKAGKVVYLALIEIQGKLL